MAYAGLSTSTSPGLRDYIVDVCPFATSCAFYEALYIDILGGEGVEVIILLSVTAHPAGAVAARRLGSRVLTIRRYSPHA